MENLFKSVNGAQTMIIRIFFQSTCFGLKPGAKSVHSLILTTNFKKKLSTCFPTCGKEGGLRRNWRLLIFRSRSYEHHHHHQQKQWTSCCHIAFHYFLAFRSIILWHGWKSDENTIALQVQSRLQLHVWKHSSSMNHPLRSHSSQSQLISVWRIITIYFLKWTCTY